MSLIPLNRSNAFHSEFSSRFFFRKIVARFFPKSLFFARNAAVGRLRYFSRRLFCRGIYSPSSHRMFSNFRPSSLHRMFSNLLELFAGFRRRSCGGCHDLGCAWLHLAFCGRIVRQRRHRHLLHAAHLLPVDQVGENRLRTVVGHVCTGLLLHGELCTTDNDK